jgi:hypothetical protein
VNIPHTVSLHLEAKSAQAARQDELHTSEFWFLAIKKTKPNQIIQQMHTEKP